MKLKYVRSVYFIILNNKIGFFCCKTFFSIIKFIFALLTNKNNNIVLFGAMNGIKYGDNAKRLYEYMLKNHKDIECYWMTNSLKVWKKLKNDKLPVKLSWTFSGLWILNLAKIGCYCNTLRDLSFDPLIIPDNISLISLRHGISVKGGGFSLNNYNDRYNDFIKYFHKLEYSKISYVISTSEYITSLIDKKEKNGIEKYIITGFPRLDSLIDPLNGSKELFYEKILGNKKYTQILLYAPTWRDGIKPPKFFPFDDFEIKSLYKVLINKNIKLLIRPHFDDFMLFPKLKKILDDIEYNSNGYISIVNHNKCEDLYVILPYIDILLTDYSSIYHDFLLLDRPIYFIPYDYTWYKDFFGFIYDYKKEKPGPEISTFSSFTKELQKSLNGIDKYSNKRKMLRNKIHYYQDANSSKRVAGKVIEMLT